MHSLNKDNFFTVAMTRFLKRHPGSQCLCTQWCLMLPKPRSMPLSKVLLRMTGITETVSFPFFLNHFLIMTCTKIWLETSFSLLLSFLDKYNFSKKKKYLPGFYHSQEAKQGDHIWEAAPPAECGCLLPRGSLTSPRPPPGGAAETRGVTASRPSPRECVLTGQGDDRAEILIAANAVLWKQNKHKQTNKMKVENACDTKTPQTLPRLTFLPSRNILGA